MNLADVMDEVCAKAATIEGLRCSPGPIGQVTPPFLVVVYPEEIDFDAAYARGADTMTLPVVVGVGAASDRAARKKLGAYCDGDGPASVKAVLEAGTYTTFDSLRVQKIEFDQVSIGGVEYVAATFTLDIIGTGAA